MNLDHLRYFQTLARCEHYAQAAKELNITQPSLSYAIAGLERELEVPLFARQGRNIVLTQYGRFFLEYVNNAIHELQTGQAALRELVSNSASYLNLAFIYSLSSFYIPTLIQSFQKKYPAPKAIFNLHNSDTAGILTRLRTGTSDFGFFFSFASGVSVPKDMELHCVMRRNLVVIVPKNHPLAAQDSLNIYDLDSFPIVSFPSGSPLGELIRSLFSKTGVSPNYVYGMEDEAGIAGLVSNHLGISIVPHAPILDNFEIAIRPLVCPSYSLHICIAYPKNKPLSPLAKDFLEFILSQNTNESTLPQE